ncbi:MAG: PQQ-binding-like beta-propeller repeat protein [Planctomycetota bacterium]
MPKDFDDVNWMKKDISCRSAPIIMDGKVYVVSKVGEGADELERVVCMDAINGDVIWEHRFPVFFTDIVSVRLGWTIPVGDPKTGNVYIHGTQGLLFCFDGQTGKVKWQKSLTEEFGRITGYGGRVTSPIVDGDLVLISMLNSNWGSQAGGGCRFFAFDKLTGQVRWWNTTGIRPTNTYSCVPVVTTIDGQRILISGGGDGHLHAFQVHTGKKLWSFELGSGAINPSPVVDGGLVYAAHGDEIPNRPTVGRLTCLDISRGTPKVVWDLDGIEFHFPSPTLDDGKLFIPDRQGRMYCYDAKTGQRLWRSKFGRQSFGSPVLADGKIYQSDVYGNFSILDANNQGKVLARKRFQPADPRFDVEVPGSAAIANGCVYFGTTEEFYCLGAYKKVDVEVAAQALDPGPNPEGEPAQLLVSPAEVFVKPGEPIRLSAKFFDANGRLVGNAEPEYRLASMGPGPGLGADADPPRLEGGLKTSAFTAPKLPGGQMGEIIASANGLNARVRVLQYPSFPYKEDFETTNIGLIPEGWTNSQLRFVIEEIDGNRVLTKTATIAVPFYREWYAFMGPPEMDGYTVESDLMGEKVGENMPNMGVTANRYTLQMVGNEQILRLTAWDAVPRVSAELEYPWEAGTWYRMKLTTVQAEANTFKVLGKVWPKREAEPDSWTIVLDDPNPNRNGPPGLYGSALGIQPPKPGTKIFYDNVLVQ